MLRSIYNLKDELANDPEQVELAQALSLDGSRPDEGLRGAQGLFGSEEWWKNIESGVIATIRRRGTIRKAYSVGQDGTELPNELEIIDDTGRLWREGVYALSENDVGAYVPGKRIEIIYALDELKARSKDGSPSLTEIVLEVLVDV